ncbi:MAG: family F420-dependent class oxidoreductase [Microbacteriaceae bacterium]|nr:family F420-dependent class oxidoreductase [Microbacteriaceae bacterium]
MKLGIHFMNFTLPGEPQTLAGLISSTAKIADEGGVSSFTFMDHWFQMEAFSNAHDPMLEGYTSLGFVAGQTSRVKLGLLVTGVTYRYPGLLAQTVTTLDVLSSGRAVLGIGAAWYEREHLALGVPYPPIKERFERLEETLQICKQFWSGDEGPYEGKYYQLAETILQPKPIQAGGPKIMIGGSGEKKTLRLVAKYGDQTNLFAPSPDEVAHKLDVLREHCDTEGRDYSEIENTIIYGGDPFAPEFLPLMEEYAKLGISEVKMGAKTEDPAAWTARVVKEVLPKLDQI